MGEWKLKDVEYYQHSAKSFWKCFFLENIVLESSSVVVFGL